MQFLKMLKLPRPDHQPSDVQIESLEERDGRKEHQTKTEYVSSITVDH